jgi:hypothetical protein
VSNFHSFHDFGGNFFFSATDFKIFLLEVEFDFQRAFEIAVKANDNDRMAGKVSALHKNDSK